MPNISLKKFWRRKSVTISEYDPIYKVTYLGNVLTGWAKGEGCLEKPLSTLWRNYCQSNRPDISMKVTICDAGLKAFTNEHGLTEYWAHRVTYCASHPAYPRVFCWVYRHEGRRLKQELRCHAVLCPKQGKAELMATQLRARLSAALQEFRREKLIRQNARLSLVHAVYDSAALPLRKVYLITGASNYRPPLERSKSAPKLGAIEEILEEEEEEEMTSQALVAEDDTKSLSGASVSSAVPLSDRDETFKEKVSEEACAADADSVSYSAAPSDVIEEDFASEPGNPIPEHEFILEESRQFPLPRGRRSYSVEMNFSSPDLLFYRVPPLIERDNASNDGDTVVETNDSRRIENYVANDLDTKSSPRSIQESEEIDMLTSFKEKLAIRHGREESLTSDQPESIGSHSCNSSCSDGGTESETLIEVRDVVHDILKVPHSNLKDEQEDCDNISEESGYSEDKEYLPLGRVKETALV